MIFEQDIKVNVKMVVKDVDGLKAAMDSSALTEDEFEALLNSKFDEAMNEFLLAVAEDSFDVELQSCTVTAELV